MLKLTHMPIVDLVLPKLGESIMEATILKWHKKVGDTIQLDETLLDIATDKVDSEIPSTTEGIITEILFEVNAVVPIGTVIARIRTTTSSSAPIIVPPIVTPIIEKKLETIIENIVTNEPTVTEEVPYVPSAPIQMKAAPIQDNKIMESVKSNNSQINTNTTQEAKFYSPLVLNIAQNEGVSMDELQHINGTGTNGRITKKDILDFIARKKMAIHLPSLMAGEQNINEPILQTQTIQEPIAKEPATRPLLNKPLDVYENTTSNFSASKSTKLANPNEVIISGASEIVEMDRMRKLIAKHMVDSVQTSPHVTSFVEVDVTNMVVWRDKVKELFER